MRRGWSGRAGVAALALTVVTLPFLTWRTSNAVFSGTTGNGANSLTLAALVVPGSPGCTWTGGNSLNVSWTNTNAAVATGHQVERSNTSGSGFAALGTTSPAAVVTLADANPAPTTLRYYRVEATLGTWTSPYTAEVVSNTCVDTMRAFAGGGASTACSYTGAATGLNLKFTTGSTSAQVLAGDGSGNLYVADTGNNCIRKIDSSGNVTWVAGGGATSTCGTTTAANLSLNHPEGIDVDTAGNVYVADTAAGCVRKIDTSGNVTAVAGGGATTSCGTTTATAVSLSSPVGVGVDSSGNVYIGDSGHHCLRKVAGSTVTAFAGTGTTAGSCATTGTAATSANFRETDAISVDTSNNIYVTDAYQACLYKISGGSLTRIAGISGGSQASCAFTGDPTTVSYYSGYTEGTAVDTSGRAYFSIRADTDAMGRSCVIRVSGSVAAQSAGQNGTGTTGDNGPATGATMTAPAALAFTSNGDLFIADANLVRRVITP